MAAWSSLPYLRLNAVPVVHRWCLGTIAIVGNATALDRARDQQPVLAGVDLVSIGETLEPGLPARP